MLQYNEPELQGFTHCLPHNNITQHLETSNPFSYTYLSILTLRFNFCNTMDLPRRQSRGIRDYPLRLTVALETRATPRNERRHTQQLLPHSYLILKSRSETLPSQ